MRLTKQRNREDMKASSPARKIRDERRENREEGRVSKGREGVRE